MRHSKLLFGGKKIFFFGELKVSLFYFKGKFASFISSPLDGKKEFKECFWRIWILKQHKKQMKKKLTKKMEIHHFEILLMASKIYFWWPWDISISMIALIPLGWFLIKSSGYNMLKYLFVHKNQPTRNSHSFIFPQKKYHYRTRNNSIKFNFTRQIFVITFNDF